MPQQSRTEEQRGEALRKLAFPSKNLTEDRRNFEQQYGPLRDDEFDAILSKRYATLGLSKRCVEVCGFLRRQFDNRLVVARQLQQKTRKIVLRFGRQRLHSL